jgi:CDP-diacylglycerol--glycerol-3-phosphate 3-phosphatidyltransferase
MSVPSRSEYFDRWSALHGGVRPTGSTFVNGWLTLIYTLARPLAQLRVHPDVLTLAGVLVAGMVVLLAHLGGGWLIAAAVVVAVSGVFDSLDGAVAILTDRSSRWGALLDSLVDRVSDLLYLVALWLVGAPSWLCIAAGGAMFLLEYARARSLAIGMDDVGVISVGERPTRVTVVAMFLLAAGIYSASGDWWATVGVAALLLLCLVGLVQFLWVARRRLSDGAE